MSEQKTTIIRPKTGWFDLPIRELFRYRDLILLFVKRDFVSLYKQISESCLVYVVLTCRLKELFNKFLYSRGLILCR